MLFTNPPMLSSLSRYVYYAAATLGYRSPLAKVLTNLQMLQFMLGITLSSCILFYEECASATPASKAALVTIQVRKVT